MGMEPESRALRRECLWIAVAVGLFAVLVFGVRL